MENQSESSNDFFYQETFKKYTTRDYKNCFHGGLFSYQTPEAPSGGNKGWASGVVLYYAAFLVNFGVAACLLKRLYLLLPRVEN